MKQTIFAFVLGIIIGGIATHITITDTEDQHSHHVGADGKHPVGYADNQDEVHIHSDFLMIINGTEIDFTNDRYQTTDTQELHENIHLHDNVGNVIHRHAENVTLGEFFTSLGYTFTDTCLMRPESDTPCEQDGSELLVFVNDERMESPSQYINQEEDRILIYYGDPDDNELIRASLMEITDEACIYSGTCPERGVAPPESCGLTCEI